MIGPFIYQIVFLMNYTKDGDIPHQVIKNGLTSIPAWISNCNYHKVWDEITYPFPNFNGYTVEVWKWRSNFVPHFTGHVITYPCLDWSLSMLVKWAPWYMINFPEYFYGSPQIPSITSCCHVCIICVHHFFHSVCCWLECRGYVSHFVWQLPYFQLTTLTNMVIMDILATLPVIQGTRPIYIH